MSEYLTPSYIAVSRAPAVSIKDGQGSVNTGSVDQAMASGNLSRVAFSLGPGNINDGESFSNHTNVIDRANITGLLVDPLDRTVLSDHAVGIDAHTFNDFRQFAIVEWLLSHGNRDEVATDLEAGGFNGGQEFYRKYASWLTANYAMAESINRHFQDTQLPIGINDPYYFAPTAQMLRNMGYSERIVGMNHITFPSLEDLSSLGSIEGHENTLHVARMVFEPWLSFDQICFHTDRDIQRFQEVMGSLFPDTPLPETMVNSMGINLERVENIAGTITAEDEVRILEGVAAAGGISAEELQQQLAEKTVVMCLGNRVDPIKSLDTVAAAQAYLDPQQTITVLQARMNRAESQSYIDAHEAILESAARANEQAPGSVVVLDQSYENAEVIRIAAVLGKRAKDAIICAPPGVEGWCISAQEAFVAASQHNPNTGFVGTTGIGLGIRLAERGVPNILDITRPTADQLAEIIAQVASLHPDDRREMNSQVYAVMEEHQIEDWVRNVSGMLQLTTVN